MLRGRRVMRGALYHLVRCSECTAAVGVVPLWALCRCGRRAAVGVVQLWASCRCGCRVSAGRCALSALSLWACTRVQGVSTECAVGVDVVPLWASCRCGRHAAVGVVPLWVCVGAGRCALSALSLWACTRAQGVSTECAVGVNVVPL